MAKVSVQPPLNNERVELPYVAHFELGDDPFRTVPNPMYAYANDSLIAGLQQARNVVNGRTGLAAISGEIGIGKTTLAYATAEDLRNRGVALAFFARRPGNARQTEASVMAEIAKELGRKNKTGNSAIGYFNEIARFAEEQDRLNRDVAVIIDDAQEIREGGIKCLLQLLAVQTMQGQLVQILLFGQSPELFDVLKSNRALHSRLAGALELKALGAKEVEEMIAYRLKVATMTRKQPIFDRAALRRIAHASRGIPRLVCRIAQYACIEAAAKNAPQVTEPFVVQAAQELRHEGTAV